MTIGITTKTDVQALRLELDKALKVLEKHGLVASIGNIQYVPGMNARMKLTITSKQNALKPVTIGGRTFNVGDQFTHPGQPATTIYRFVGANPSSKKFPYLVERALKRGTGMKRHKVGASWLMQTRPYTDR